MSSRLKSAVCPGSKSSTLTAKTVTLGVAAAMSRVTVLIGTYSSIFVASPTVLALGAKAQDLIPEEVEKEGEDQPEVPYMP